MLYENGYDLEGNMTYLLTDEVDPNFYQFACPFEPDGYYSDSSDDEEDDDSLYNSYHADDECYYDDDDLPF